MLAAFLLAFALFLLYRLALAIDRQFRRRAPSPPPIAAIVLTAPPAPVARPLCASWLDEGHREAFRALVSPEAYEAERERWRGMIVLETVNGHDIRAFPSDNRWGTCYRLGDIDHDTIAEARAAAALLPTGSPLL